MGSHDETGKGDEADDLPEQIEERLAEADPTGQRGRPLMVSGFVLILLLGLGVMLVIAVIQR